MVQTQVPGLLKEMFSKEDIAYETLVNNPLLAVMPKDENLGGSDYRNFLVYGGSSSGSATFTTSQTNGGPPPTASFIVPPSQDYVTLQISNKLIRSAKGGGEKSFIDELALNMKAALDEMGYSLCNTIQGDGTGSRGKVAASSALSTGSVTLTDPQQIVGFQQNMWCQFAYVSGSTWQLAAAGAQYQITGLDEDNSILNFGTSNNLASPTSGQAVAANMIVIRSGDLVAGTAYNNGLGVTGAQVFAGLGGWNPLSAPQPNTGDSFGTVDRSGSTTRLAGVRFDGRGLSPLMAARGLAARMERQKGAGDFDYIVANMLNYENLASTISGQARYEWVESFDDPTIRFEMLTLPIGGRHIKAVKDRTIPSSVLRVLSLKYLCLRSMGPLSGILDYEMYGEGVLVISNVDGIEIRWGVYPALYNQAPAWQGLALLNQP
jgi:hypothetical protein